MGYDLNIVVEKKHSGRWVAWNLLTQRESHGNEEYTDLGFPGALLRNDIRYQALGFFGHNPERYNGAPIDASDTVKLLMHELGNDLIGANWMSAAMALPIFIETEAPEGVELPPDTIRDDFPEWYYFGIIADPRDSAALDPYRIVFWLTH